jgi:hypothetical protein
MFITLDNLAHRYNCLPSEALQRATTLDLYVLDISTKWFKYQSDRADGNQPKAKEPTVEEMKAMIENVKKAKNDKI